MKLKFEIHDTNTYIYYTYISLNYKRYCQGRLFRIISINIEYSIKYWFILEWNESINVKVKWNTIRIIIIRNFSPDHSEKVIKEFIYSIDFYFQYVLKLIDTEVDSITLKYS